MIVLKGKYGEAKVFTGVIDEGSISDIINILNQPFSKNANVRIMPDVHKGKAFPIGTTMKITDKVVPAGVSVDIGCGMLCAELNVSDELDLEKIDNVIREYVPNGFNVHDSNLHGDESYSLLRNLYCFEKINLDRALRSIGTLGGGNHFIEINKGNKGTIYLVIHSGSRHLGVEVATFYQNLAFEKMNEKINNKEAIINKLKREGRTKEIENVLRNMPKISLEKNLAYLEDELFDNYIHDMKIVQKYAELNRETMLNIIVSNVSNITVKNYFHTTHNYIDTNDMILRKGAVSAKNGEMLLIPINMQFGSLLCVGKGNEDWNYSAPHGAGRLMSRSEAKKRITMKEFEKSMEGIYSTSVKGATKDEAPMAYKNAEDILNNINDAVDVIDIIKPLYNFKAN